MSAEWQASNPLAPRNGQVIVLTTGQSAAATTFPASWIKGRFVGMYADVDTYILTAETSGVTATSGISGVSTSSGACGILPAGMPQFARLSKEDQWLHHVATTDGIIRVWLASP